MTVLVNDKSTIRNVKKRKHSAPEAKGQSQRQTSGSSPDFCSTTGGICLFSSTRSLSLRKAPHATSNKLLWTTVAFFYNSSKHVPVQHPYLLWVHQLILHTVSAQRFQEIHGNTLTCESGPNPTFPRGHPWATPESSQNTPGTPRMFLEPFALPATAHPEATRKSWWKEITVGKMQLSKASFPKMVRCVLDLLEKFVELSHVLLV